MWLATAKWMPVAWAAAAGFLRSRLLCAGVLAVALSPAAAALPPEVEQALAQAGVAPENVAMVVAPVVAGGAATAPDHALAWRAEAPMNPASVMKVVTTFAALDLLGPEYFWKTRIFALGPVEDGVLHGNLLIRGSGDPKLVWDRLGELFFAAHAKGLNAIDGDIVLDHGIFRLPPHDPAAFDQEPMRPYNVGPDGLLINFKTLTFKFLPQSGAKSVRIESEPPIAGVQIPTRVRSAAGACGDWKSQLQGDFADPARVVFRGSYPRACGEQEWSVAYVDPPSYAPRVVRALWQDTGGKLSGEVKWATPTPADADAALRVPWVTGYSLPLAEIIADINQYSNNVMAQQLFLTLSTGDGESGTFARSTEKLRAWWRRSFGHEAAPALDNGSGLSRDGRVSAAALAALLQRAATGPHAVEFERSLPIAGINGTARYLARRSPESEAIGRARFKTGTLRDVIALAGYAWGRSGRQYVVVGLINDPNAKEARPALDRLVEWAVQDSR